jgi:hypothetical protein
MEFSMHVIMAQLANERTRENIQLAEQLHCTRRLRALHRARRTGRKAERRMIAAWRRADELEN